MAASEIASEMGLICSFMPKPFANRPATACTCTCRWRRQEEPVPGQEATRGLDLSPMAYHFLGGLLKHARALAAICAPTVNLQAPGGGPLAHRRDLGAGLHQLRRQQPLAMVRIPYGRLELRLPDGACNPYLATAAVIAAGMDGIERKLDPGAPHNVNLYDWSAGAS
jgi:glutamine synthetase